MTTLQLVQSGETDIIVRRDFAHPPALVWRALTEPALILKWLAPRDALIGCELDARAGGSFRYEWPEFTFHGVIVTYEPPHRMVHAETFSRDPDYRVERTTELVAQGTGTRMTVIMRYADAAARVAAVAAGFTDGLVKVYGRIDDLQFAD